MNQPRTELPQVTDPLVYCNVLLLMLTELNMTLGLDPDGSHTPARAEGVVGTFEKLAPVVHLGDEARDEAGARSRQRLAGYLRTLRPLMSRLARPAE